MAKTTETREAEYSRDAYIQLQERVGEQRLVYPIPKMRHGELPESINNLTGQIVDSALAVHRESGPGLLESVYQDALAAELTARGIPVAMKARVPIRYRGAIVGDPLEIDLLVGDTVVVEVKAVENFHGVHWAQVLSYLKLARKPVGLLINFHEFALRDGIRRVVPPTLSEPPPP